MKRLANPTLNAAMLLAILSIYACLMVKDLGVLKKSEGRLATVLGDELQYRAPAGIAIDGKLVDAASLGAKKYVVFLLRSQSVQHDLAFWDRVNALVSGRAGLRLIGYCDSLQCADSIETMASPTFPVLMYGDPIGIQAVVAADARGLAILKGLGMRASQIAWRDPGTTARRIAEEAIR